MVPFARMNSECKRARDHGCMSLASDRQHGTRLHCAPVIGQPLFGHRPLDISDARIHTPRVKFGEIPV